jgi:hypothetical protein
MGQFGGKKPERIDHALTKAAEIIRDNLTGA